MFNRNPSERPPVAPVRDGQSPFVCMEGLEGRCFLSASHHGASTTTFAALQTSDAAAAAELTTLATADNLTISSTQSVNVQKLTSTTTDYSVVLAPSAGVRIRLTTDQAGNPVTPPTNSKVAFSTITNTAVTDELITLASDLSLAAPTATTVVDVNTTQGLTTYSVDLAKSSGKGHKETITVDSSGDPAGNMVIPFSALPTGGVIASGLSSLAAALSPTQTIASTDNVVVATAGGETTYTVKLTGTGESIKLTVDTSGTATTPVHRKHHR